MLYQSAGTSGSGVTRRLDHIYDDSGIQTKPCITLYIIMSLWLYASAAWDPYASDQINKFDKVQRRAARFVSNNYRDKTPGCVTAMVKSLGCEPLTEHRKSHKFIMMYKVRKLRRMNPNVLEALDDVASTCFLQLRSSLSVTPRYLPVSTTSSLAARFVSNNYRDKPPGCVTAMVKSLGCEPLTEHRKSHKFIMMYKVMHGLVCIFGQRHMDPRLQTHILR
jgi:hypothetical protein